MGSTHILFGMIIAYLYSYIQPELLFPLTLAAILGSIIPDLDMPFDHRKTLHYPVYYSIGAILSVPIFIFSASLITGVVSMLFLSMALHCLVDVLGCGLEPRPWEANNDQAVYFHYPGFWAKPRRWIKYDGSPGDHIITLSLAIVLMNLYTYPFKQFVAAVLVSGTLYTFSRRILKDLAPSFMLKTFGDQ